MRGLREQLEQLGGDDQRPAGGLEGGLAFKDAHAFPGPGQACGGVQAGRGGADHRNVKVYFQ